VGSLASGLMREAYRGGRARVEEPDRSDSLAEEPGLTVGVFSIAEARSVFQPWPPPWRSGPGWSTR